jgi:hypothetical protein
MSKLIQIRNVPDELHHVLKSRAARQGKSLSAYLIDELYSISGITPPRGPSTVAEVLARLRSRVPVTPEFSAADAIRELRGPLPPG